MSLFSILNTTNDIFLYTVMTIHYFCNVNNNISFCYLPRIMDTTNLSLCGDISSNMDYCDSNNNSINNRDVSALRDSSSSSNSSSSAYVNETNDNKTIVEERMEEGNEFYSTQSESQQQAALTNDEDVVEVSILEENLINPLSSSIQQPIINEATQKEPSFPVISDNEDEFESEKAKVHTIQHRRTNNFPFDKPNSSFEAFKSEQFDAYNLLPDEDYSFNVSKSYYTNLHIKSPTDCRFNCGDIVWTLENRKDTTTTYLFLGSRFQKPNTVDDNDDTARPQTLLLYFFPIEQASAEDDSLLGYMITYYTKNILPYLHVK